MFSGNISSASGFAYSSARSSSDVSRLIREINRNWEYDFVIRFHDEIIRNEDLTHLASALNNNTFLLYLQFYNCDMGQNPGCLFDAVLSHPKLEDVSLVNCQLDCAAMQAWSSSLIQHPPRQLDSLFFSSNPLKDAGVKALAHGLKQSSYSNLQRLDLASTGMTDTGVIALADSLQKHLVFCQLVLRGNQITSVGALTIAELIQNRPDFLGLNLAQNSIDDKGAEAFAATLARHQNLLSLNLANNKITEKGGLAILDALRKNSHSRLLKLDLSNNKISDATLKRIHAVLTERRGKIIAEAFELIADAQLMMAYGEPEIAYVILEKMSLVFALAQYEFPRNMEGIHAKRQMATADRLVRRGEELMQAERLTAAHESFTQALILQKNHVLARAQLERVEARLRPPVSPPPYEQQQEQQQPEQQQPLVA